MPPEGDTNPGAGIRLVAGGDVMLGEHPLTVGWGLGTRLRRVGAPYPFAHLRELMAGADLAVANLECSLADRPRGAPYDACQCLGPAAGVASLVAAGFRTVSVANNHVLQHGPDVFRATLAALRRAGVEPVGEAAGAAAEPDAGHLRCRPVDREAGGVPLRLLAYSLRPRQHFTEPPLYAEPTAASLLADVRAGHAAGRTVVVSLHWGDEFVARPSPAQVALGRRLVDEGATLVLGHHPHVLQGWERRGDGLIAYSLGNLAFDMLWQEPLRRSALLEVRLAPGKVLDAVWHPLWIGADFQPRPAPPAEVAAITGFLARAAAELAARPEADAAAEAAEAAYRAEVARALQTHRRASHLFFARNLWRYRPRVLAAILDKAFLRRTGRLRD